MAPVLRRRTRAMLVLAGLLLVAVVGLAWFLVGEDDPAALDASGGTGTTADPAAVPAGGARPGTAPPGDRRAAGQQRPDDGRILPADP
ncbi:MAG TPA: hypothetical protein VG411_08740, partial [Actinomycetota bacterium]|nr:hypothetical protein [Actinomycetota bacterium]